MSALSMHVALAERGIEMELDVRPGEVVAMLGPNGAGKSTALHIIAGLLDPGSGVVRTAEHVLTDTVAGVSVPPHRRRVALLTQDPLLFPHMTVAGNVAFAPRSLGRRRRAAREAARLWLRRVAAEQWADLRPHRLSGGQAQRVAIARALAAEPDVLLLDEPLAGLDVAAAAAIRPLLRGVLREAGRAAIVVTHDLLDVLTLADRAVIVERGRVVEDASAAQVLAAPRSSFAAQFAGLNLISGQGGSEGELVTADGTVWHGVGESRAAGAAVAVFRPSTVSVYREPPHGSPRNAVAVTLAAVEPRGSTVRVRAVDQADGNPGPAADITAAAALEMRLAVGDRVYFVVKAHEVGIHPG